MHEEKQYTKNTKGQNTQTREKNIQNEKIKKKGIIKDESSNNKLQKIQSR
jgi:hypothetical protein